MSLRTDTFALEGGLDLVTPALKKPAGRVIGGENYEPTERGYTRLGGYERFDGRPKPSGAQYWVIPYVGGSQEPQEGQTVTGATSGASGKVLALVAPVSGSYASNDATGDLVLTSVSGEFQDNEALKIGETTIATSSDEAVEAGADNDEQDQAFKIDAIETARALIEKLPGSGPVRGVWAYKGKTYAFRDNASASKGVMYESSAAGWVQKSDAFPAGGRYECLNTNFYGATDLKRMYGVNGVGKAFQWDGATLTFLSTGLPDDKDKPTHLAVMAKHLFLAFRGGSLQNSATGDPTTWTAVTGAAEIGIGEDITGLIGSARTTMIILGRSKVSYLTGTDKTNFRLDDISDDSGAIEWTAQQIMNPMYMDNRGVRDLQTTQALGNWKMGTKTELVHPWLKEKKKRKKKPVASLRVREEGQYKLFFDDGSGITMYLGRKYPEILPFKLAHIPTCTCSAEIDGEEVLYFGTEDGFVYQMNAGSSFDGQKIPAFLRLAFNHSRSPRQNKCYFKATLDVDVTEKTKLGLIAEFGFADPDNAAPPEQEFDVTGGGGFWDEDSWDELLWSAPVQGQAEAYIDGFGQNVSVGVISNESHEEPHTLSSMTIHYSYRGQER